MPQAMLILVDGLRPDALSAARCPTLESLSSRGAWTLRASSVRPSVTLPCAFSMMHGVAPEAHFVTANRYEHAADRPPGLIELACAASLRCASFYNWEPLRDLSRPGAAALSFFYNARDSDLDADDVLVDEIVRLMPRYRPDFALVYLGTVDIAGHKHGWMSAAYLAQVNRVDRLVGRVLSAVSPATTVLLASDHGGHDHTHGDGIPEDMLIPWIIAGPGIRAGQCIRRQVSLIDTAPTLARVMNLEPAPAWTGRAVDEAFAGSGA